MHTRIKAYQFPRFNGPNQNNFGFELSLRVNQYFDKNDLAKTGNIQLFTKSAFFIFMYFAPIVISYFFTLPILVFVFFSACGLWQNECSRQHAGCGTTGGTVCVHTIC